MRGMTWKYYPSIHPFLSRNSPRRRHTQAGIDVYSSARGCLLLLGGRIARKHATTIQKCKILETIIHRQMGVMVCGLAESEPPGSVVASGGFSLQRCVMFGNYVNLIPPCGGAGQDRPLLSPGIEA